MAEAISGGVILLPFSLVDKNIGFIGDGINPWLGAAHVFGWAAALGLVVMGLTTIKFWRLSGLGWWARVHASLLFIASAIFLSFAWWTHLLSPSLRF